MHGNRPIEANARFDPSRPFSLAGRVVTPALREVAWRGSVETLEPKSLEILLLLIRAGGQPVSREVLVNSVWGGAIVTDDAIHRAISKLRRGLSDDPKSPTIIGTISKSGYRLLISLEPIDADKARARLWFGGAAVVVLLLVLVVAFGVSRQADRLSFDFTQARAVTSTPGYEFAPNISRDGHYVAYVAFNPYSSTTLADVMILNRESGEVAPVADGAGMQAWPAWSPDGDAILYVDDASGGCEVRLVRIEDHQTRTVGACGDARRARLAWGVAPETAYLIDAKTDETNGLYRLNLINGARQELIDDEGSPVDIRLSPDGRSLAVAREGPTGRQNVFVVDPHANTQRRITRESRLIQGLAWTPSGRDLILSSDWAGLFRLWRLRVADGRMIAIATPGMNASEPALRANAPLYYQVWQSEINLLRLDLRRQGENARFARSNRWEWSPAPSPDGAQIAFLTNRAGTTDVWIANASGANERPLAVFDGWFDSTLSWSSGGRALALSVLRDERFGIVVLNTETGQQQRIDAQDANLRDPFFVGQDVYYASDESGVWTIRRRVGTEGAEEIVGGGLLGRAAPDGEAIYIATADGSIDRMALDSGERDHVVGPLQARLQRTWTPTRDGVVFVEGSIGEDYRLMAWNASTRRVTLLRRLTEEVHEGSVLSVDSSGGIWLAVIDASGSDLWEAPQRPSPTR